MSTTEMAQERETVDVRKIKEIFINKDELINERET